MKIYDNETNTADFLKVIDEVLNAPSSEPGQLDELSKKTLANYISKAGGTGLNSSAAHALEYGRKSRLNSDGTSTRAASMKKTMNRARGTMLAAKKLAKEDVQINELSKKTLASYTRKAADDMAQKNAESGQEHRRGSEAYVKGKPQRVVDKHQDNARRASIKAYNRKDGIARATRRLGEEQIDELSKKTLGNYAKKALRDAESQQDKGANEYSRARAFSKTSHPADKRVSKEADKASMKAYRKAVNRRYYHDKAVDKLSEEGATTRLNGTIAAAQKHRRMKGLKPLKTAYERQMDDSHAHIYAPRTYKPRNEEVQLDEISRKTKDQYKHLARRDLERAKDFKSELDYEGEPKGSRVRKDVNRIIKNRKTGLKRAKG